MSDNGWIQTFTGRKMYPLRPLPTDIDILDIAHALAGKGRFICHTKSFPVYSVAQHSILVSELVPPQDALWGLMHDAGEAYLPDIARPYKSAVALRIGRRWVPFDEVEGAILEAVATKYGMPCLMPSSVKQADLIALATEKRDLMGDEPEPWEALVGIVPLPGVILAWPAVVAKSRFLARWRQLRGAE